MVHYHVSRNSPQDLRQINPFHIFKSYKFKVNFNILIQLMRDSQVVCSSVKTKMYSHPFHACYMSLSAHPPVSGDEYQLQISSLCHFLQPLIHSLRSKYSVESLLNALLVLSFSYCESLVKRLNYIL
jgi:hypothetical protein